MSVVMICIGQVVMATDGCGAAYRVERAEVDLARSKSNFVNAQKEYRRIMSQAPTTPSTWHKAKRKRKEWSPAEWQLYINCLGRAIAVLEPAKDKLRAAEEAYQDALMSM